MTVKSIFKILLGTIAGMVLSMLLIELFNVSIASYQLRQICRMSARQACILFTSETYKGESSIGGSINIEPVYDMFGNIYVDGNFYGISPSDPEYKQKVWNKIYKDQNFKDFLNNTPEVNKYYAIEILKRVINGQTTYSAPNWNSSEAEIEEAVKASTAQMYKNNYYTTANVGIPYMDKDIVSKMYQWNLAQLLSNCDPDSIQPDGIWEETSHGMNYGTNMCVNFMGFRVYANQCKLTNFDYKVYDVSEINPNRTQVAEEVWRDLNIDVTDGGIHSQGLDGYKKRNMFKTETAYGTTVYDNQYITAVGLEYNLVATYEGITPLRNIIAFVFNSQVSGFSRDGQGVNTPPDLSGTPEANIANGPASSDTLSIGGFYGDTQSNGSHSSQNSGVLSTGKLIYTLDR